MTGSVPASTDSHDRCPLCEGDWHGHTDGIPGWNGCPGESGSDEEKKRWLERPNRAFWEGFGKPSDDEYIEALAVAYDSGDEKEFGAVLCEVCTSGIALEVLTAFMQLKHGPLGN